MEKKNRLIFQKRILAMIPTHDMGKKLKDPWKNKMKGLLFTAIFALK